MHREDAEPNAAGTQIAAGLFKLSLVLRHQAWKASGERGLTPTQSQVLSLLASLGPGLTVSGVAQQLALTKGTASEAISSLERKALVRKKTDPSDGRGVVLALTRSGRREAQRAAQWPDVVVSAIDALPEGERGGFLRGLIGLIRGLQERGAVPTSRMCAECRFFRPNAYPDARKQHHCTFLESAIADSDLRVDCPEMEPVPEASRALLLEALFAGEPIDPTALFDDETAP